MGDRCDLRRAVLVLVSGCRAPSTETSEDRCTALFTECLFQQQQYFNTTYLLFLQGCDPQSILQGTDANRTDTDEHDYAYTSKNSKSKRPLH